MIQWMYEIPKWQLGACFGAVFVGGTWLGIIFISPFLKVWLKGQAGINDLVGYALSAFGVFYGLLLGLLAVATYQNNSEVSATVAREASSLAALYRDVSAYPEPVRSELQGRLRDYTRYVVDKAWPLQRKGEVPLEGVRMMDEFQTALTKFEPTTKGQEIVHAETFRQYNDMIQLRRQRLQSIGTGIPGVMWFVVAVGAVVNTLIILCFRVRLDVHLIGGGVLSFFVGMLIFLIVVMDHPFLGGFGVGPEPFELVFRTLEAR